MSAATYKKFVLDRKITTTSNQGKKKGGGEDNALLSHFSYIKRPNKNTVQLLHKNKPTHGIRNKMLKKGASFPRYIKLIFFNNKKIV